MAISLTNIGTTSNKSGAATSISIGVGGVPAGSLILLAINDGSTTGNNPLTPTDTAGNTYHVSTSITNGGAIADGVTALFYAFNSIALVNGNTISWTPRTANGGSISAFYATGVQTGADPYDSASHANGSGTSAAPSSNTMAATPPANSLIVGVVGTLGPSGDTFTQDSTNAAFAVPPTRVGTVGGVATTNYTVAGGSVIGSTAIKYAPAITSRAWGALIAAFKPQILTGVAGTGQVGTLIGEVDKTITGVSATGQAGSVTAEADKLITGVAGTGQVGTLTVSSGSVVTLTGVAGTGQVGTLIGEVDRTIAGVAGTGQVGTFTGEIDASVIGVAGIGQVGSLKAEIDASVLGVSATGQVGTFTGEIDKSIVGVAATGAVGTVIVEIDTSLAGVSAIGQIGTLSTTGGQNVTLIGVEATGQVGTLTVSASGNAAPITGSGDEARRKYLDWKKQQRAKRKEAMTPPSKTPLQPSVPAPQQQPRTKPKILPQDVAALLLAKNLENQRAQLAQLESIDARLIDGIVGQEQQDRDDEEAILLLLLTSI